MTWSLTSENMCLNYLPFSSLAFYIVKQQIIWTIAWARIMIPGNFRHVGYMYIMQITWSPFLSLIRLLTRIQAQSDLGAHCLLSVCLETYDITTVITSMCNWLMQDGRVCLKICNVYAVWHIAAIKLRPIHEHSVILIFACPLGLLCSEIWRQNTA